MAKKKAAKPRAKKYESKVKIDATFQEGIQILVRPKGKPPKSNE